ncbi:MAG: hypothetical protein JKY53_14655 [Flavobacteriales bacterium]|nr:hypothetical protein [Flavobacteriales bacterium]
MKTRIAKNLDKYLEVTEAAFLESVIEIMERKGRDKNKIKELKRRLKALWKY